ncbi:MAG: putative toxin-antitoxin system toxin component, PIN family [Burkholderiales bacterium]
MRLVLDTGVVFSGLLWRGTTYQLLAALRQRSEVKLFSSVMLLAEFADVLSRPTSAKQLSLIGKTTKEVLEDYAGIVEFVEPAEISRTSTDPDDDAVLACGIAAQADLIVSGDPDLLNLKSYQRIPIVSPAEALTRLSERA